SRAGGYLMSIESGVSDKIADTEYSSARAGASFSTEIVPYILQVLDAFIILFSCLVGALSYSLFISGFIDVVPPCAVGLLSSFVYIFRMNRSDYYSLQESTKYRTEVHEILVSWFTTGLLLALIAFLFKISADYSRGAFVIFYILAPMALLGARKATKV